MIKHEICSSWAISPFVTMLSNTLKQHSTENGKPFPAWPADAFAAYYSGKILRKNDKFTKNEHVLIFQHYYQLYPNNTFKFLEQMVFFLWTFQSSQQLKISYKVTLAFKDFDSRISPDFSVFIVGLAFVAPSITVSNIAYCNWIFSNACSSKK